MHMTGALAGADLVAPSACAVVDAPFGVESDGPDAVVPITGLVPGETYVVHLTASADLGFYVITGCSTATGPDDAECLLYEDASPTDEVGAFVAPSETVYVVVDYYKASEPPDGAFALDVYRQTCTESSQCDATAPACVAGTCVECETSFDCKESASPVCDSHAHRCVAGSDRCMMEDKGEPYDDGPAGARLLVVDDNGAASESGQICSTPSFERDYYAFDVDAAGETWTFDLAWQGSADLDLAVADATGHTLGLSFWEGPETVTLTYLTPGRYYASVSQFTPEHSTQPASYVLSASRRLGAGCTSSADCAIEFRNQVYRGSCEAGSCVSIDGDHGVPRGGACDSLGDCADGLACPAFLFVADADRRETCEPMCSNDVDCGPEHVCSTYLQHNLCVPKCTSDAQCPTSLDDRPETGPWFRLSCDMASGRCQ